MKGKSAPGIDGIPTEFYKANIKIVVEPLFGLFNKIMLQESFPSIWATSVIVPIWKGKGSKLKVTGYRGIALQQCVSKIFAKILTQRLKAWVDQKRILTKFQAGFRSNHSTVDQAFILNTIIQKRLRRRQTTYCAFIDFSKAFDSVNRELLWYKLRAVSYTHLTLPTTPYV